jgi:hypothetical protein
MRLCVSAGEPRCHKNLARLGSFVSLGATWWRTVMDTGWCEARRPLPRRSSTLPVEGADPSRSRTTNPKGLGGRGPLQPGSCPCAARVRRAHEPAAVRRQTHGPVAGLACPVKGRPPAVWPAHGQPPRARSRLSASDQGTRHLSLPVRRGNRKGVAKGHVLSPRSLRLGRWDQARAAR